MHLRTLLAAVGLLCTACGPLIRPMVVRLDDNTQAKVDEVWDELFAEPQQLDRTFLLDAMLSAQLYQFGVETLHMTSERSVRDGRVVMEVHFEREHPERDRFTICYVDANGTLVREVNYSREEVNARANFLGEQVHTCEANEVSGVDLDSPECVEKRRRAAQLEARKTELELLLGPLLDDSEQAE